MILLLILIVALIAYLITHHYDEKRFSSVKQTLRQEFQDHIYQKEREHVCYIDDLNIQFNKRIEDQIGRFTVKYNQLKDEYQESVKGERKDAIKRSKQVVSGQVYENISPLVPGFPYELKDVRHVGSPLDFLVFRGLSDSDSELEIVFLEIKSGVSALNSNERRVKKAIEAGRVRYDVFHPDADHEVEEKLESSVRYLKPVSESNAAILADEVVLPPSAALYETLICGHCKKEFNHAMTSGRKPLFCPQCRGTG